MAIEAQDAEFRHPDTAACLRGLTDEEAAKQPPLVREQDGVAWHYWREGGRVCCCEAAFGTEALHAAVEAEFGRSLRWLEAELRGGGVPDLDAIKTLLRDRSLAVGAKVCADLPEARDAALPAPACPSCGRRMERHGRAGKTFEARMGPIRIERTYVRCRACGVAFHHPDRVPGLEGKTAAPGAESLYADVAGSESYGPASRKLKNLSGVEVSASTLQRHVAGIGGEIQAFEREDAEAPPPAERVLPGIDGTGVPMAAREVDSLDPKAVSVRIDSAQAVNGVGRASEFAARLEQFAHRNGVFAAEEVVVLSDGAPWIRTVCEEILPGRKTTFILDLCRALEYASAAVQAAAPDEGRREAWMDRIRKQLDAGRVKTGRRRSEAAPPVRSGRGLHPHLRGQYGPDALRPLPETRIAGRIRHRGKRLQAHRRKPAQRSRAPLVESGRQRRARHQALARLPRLEGLQRRSSLTQENGMHPSAGPSRTQGASIRSRRRAAMNVEVFQWPKGADPRTLCPLGPQPRPGDMPVFIQVSSMKTSLRGSALP